MSAWRLAGSLITLRGEVDGRWPDRNKASDGTIGDPAHAGTASDHNPNAAGVVCALDITNDPASGCTGQWLFDTIRAHPQPDAKYIIANRQIASAKYNWTVRPYTGSDPHTSHIHVSVGVGPDGQSQPPYDDRFLWLPPPDPTPPPPEDDDMIRALVHVDDTADHRQWTFTVTDTNVLRVNVAGGWFDLAGEWSSLIGVTEPSPGKLSVTGFAKTPADQVWRVDDDGAAWGAPYAV